MARVGRWRWWRQLALSLTCLLLVISCNSNPDAPDSASNTTEAPSASSNETLIVATEPAFPPFEMQAESGGGLDGFDIELMNAIGEEAGVKVEYESLPFDGIIPALQSGKVNAAISAMTITPERAETVSFSRPYFKSGLAIAVREDNQNINGFDDLKNKKIAVQIGTTGAKSAEEIAGANISTFDSAPLALQELSNGNVDAVINDAPVTLYAIKEGNLTGLKVVGELVTEEYYGIALPKESENVETINTALNTLIENGTYKEIYQKWFNAEPPELPETAPST